MSSGSIITRQDAEKEVKALIRADKRRGGVMGVEAVAFRRANSARMLEAAKSWRSCGRMTVAVSVAKSARAQLIIARGLARYLTK